ncbi:MAG: DeoR/GlpR family DNA-binding transcription regulator [Devosia sp.]
MLTFAQEDKERPQMPAETRRLKIIEHLRAHETAEVDAFAKMFSVSRMTVHRDLDALVEQRIVRKVRGGATILPSVIFEGDYAYRARLQGDEKNALGRAASHLVEPGMAIVLDDSSTVAAVIPFLLDKRPLTVVTNALPVIQMLDKAPGITLIALGGILDPICNAFLGILTEQSMRSIRVDLALLSTACVHGATAYLRVTDDAIRAKHAMMESADRSVMMVDHTKFGKSALNRFTELSRFDRVLVTDGLRRDHREALRRAKVRLELVRTTPSDASAPMRNA